MALCISILTGVCPRIRSGFHQGAFILKFAMPERCVILLVEDDENDAFFVKRALTKLGFPGKIHHATDTDEAKRYIRGDVPYADREKFRKQKSLWPIQR